MDSHIVHWRDHLNQLRRQYPISKKPRSDAAATTATLYTQLCTTLCTTPCTTLYITLCTTVINSVNYLGGAPVGSNEPGSRHQSMIRPKICLTTLTPKHQTPTPKHQTPNTKHQTAFLDTLPGANIRNTSSCGKHILKNSGQDLMKH